MNKLLLILMIFCSFDFYGQIISQFTWDTNPVTMADIGPNAVSVSSSATSSPNGVGGTNGLNAGLPKQDINLIIADDPIFDVGGIDISFDYQRDESQGAFFTRGNSLVIDGCANLSVRYRVDNGIGGFNTISSGNAFAIPNDNTFRTYRFVYIPASGIGTLLVDGVITWSNDGPDGRDLYWAGAGDIIIGSLMDGSGSNRTFLDNLTIGEVTNSALPITITYFEAKERNNKYVDLNWETSTEINNDYFTIERSYDGISWDELTTIEGAGNSNTAIYYNTKDWNPYIGLSYYRLKQTDFNGGYSYSKTRSVNIESNAINKISVYPNPSNGIVNIVANENFLRTVGIYNSIGQKINYNIKYNSSKARTLIIDISNFPNGVYFVKSENVTKKFVKN